MISRGHCAGLEEWVNPRRGIGGEMSHNREVLCQETLECVLICVARSDGFASWFPDNSITEKLYFRCCQEIIKPVFPSCVAVSLRLMSKVKCICQYIVI